MVIKSDGTKWACSSCLKGHRVSGCTHADRELTLVPKKGRPVTQCQHCRAERKKRSAHVSCECGEAEKPHHPKEKCVHLRDNEERSQVGLHDEAATEKTSAYLHAVAEEQGCCCHHGGNCTCAMLRRNVDKDGTVTPPHGPVVKPRLDSTKSDGSITVFQNGHHKPCHRKNHLAHDSGMPYKVPMPRSKTDVGSTAKARRSVDSLALDNSMLLNPSAFLPQTSAPFNTDRRMSKSEQPSPRISAIPCAGLSDPKFAAIDFGNLQSVQTNQNMPSMPTDPFAFMPLEPMSSVTESTFDPWSAMPSSDSLAMPNNNPFGVWPTSTDVGGTAQPALTAASSGTQSEIDEMPLMDEMYGFGMPSIQEDAGSYTLAMLQSSGSPQSNRRSLPANFFKSLPADAQWAENLDSDMANGSQEFNSAQTFNFDDVWEGSNLPAITDMPTRAMGGSANPGRPSSKSLGPESAPSDAIFQSLFPEIDIHGSYFGTPCGAQVFTPSNGTRTTSTANNCTTPMDFGPMNEELDFTSQQWSDGSMTVPNDEFTAPYTLDREFADPDYPDTWAQ
ncbi:hypothetical protein LTR53_007433 [Teratosphaeriaceae sp. CCFEE 6253]|nr:hypothetical protein LTR53_007433 [Teratosphaeriaceae sp. CCFEE 6253]